ncbi:MAG: hypothetical protein ACE14M_00800 [Terriglobales bacterium]
METKCVDKIVGEILAGWRYDISGIAPEMRGDYEAHFTACERCRYKQRLHRTIDVGLMILAAASTIVFMIAFGAVHHFAPRHTLILEIAALAGFLLSILVWLLVAVVTPAPLLMVDAALLGARRVHDRLPEGIRDRIPEELRLKISGQS